MLLHQKSEDFAKLCYRRNGRIFVWIIPVAIYIHRSLRISPTLGSGKLLYVLEAGIMDTSGGREGERD